MVPTLGMVGTATAAMATMAMMRIRDMMAMMRIRDMMAMMRIRDMRATEATRGIHAMRTMATVMATRIPGMQRMVLHMVMEVTSDLFEVYRLPLAARGVWSYGSFLHTSSAVNLQTLFV